MQRACGVSHYQQEAIALPGGLLNPAGAGFSRTEARDALGAEDRTGVK